MAVVAADGLVKTYGEGRAARRVLETVADDARWDELSTLARDRVRAYDERVVAGLWREALGLD